MITQYEAVAEIEAMKAARPRKRASQPATQKDAAGFGWGSSENAIRAEMERRLARRAAKQAQAAHAS